MSRNGKRFNRDQLLLTFKTGGMQEITKMCDWADCALNPAAMAANLRMTADVLDEIDAAFHTLESTEETNP